MPFLPKTPLQFSEKLFCRERERLSLPLFCRLDWQNRQSPIASDFGSRDSSQQVLNPTPAVCHNAKNRSCAIALFGKLRNCRNCTATFAFLQCGCHFYKKLAILQHWKSCAAEKWGFPAHLSSCRFQAHTFRHPRWGSIKSNLKNPQITFKTVSNTSR